MKSGEWDRSDLARLTQRLPFRFVVCAAVAAIGVALMAFDRQQAQSSHAFVGIAWTLWVCSTAFMVGSLFAWLCLWLRLRVSASKGRKLTLASILDTLVVNFL